MPGIGGARVGDRELELAVQLIETLRTEWDPAAYADTYREDLLRILSEKAPTATPVAAGGERPAATDASAVEQLMAALKESVDAARARQKQRRPSRSKKAG
jgi:DNA end-binding protein Ku